MIVHEEIGRWKVRGFDDGVIGGMVISAPTVLNFGSAKLKQELIPKIFAGEKRICLAITEPYAGSDVARIRTTAVKTADGKHYIVNGVKVIPITKSNYSTHTKLSSFYHYKSSIRNGLRVVVGLITSLLPFKPIRVSPCFLSNDLKVLKPSLLRLLTLPLLVLLMSHLKTSRFPLKTCWVRKTMVSKLFFPTLTTNVGSCK
jgi:hypothetical protein